MKHIFNILMYISFAIALTGCGGSNFSSEKQDEVSTLAPDDPVTPFNDNQTQDLSFVTNHCSDIASQEHVFYGFMKNVLNRPMYGEFIESQTDCSSYNGWFTYVNGSQIFHQYESSHGTKSCDWWNQQPMGISLAFFRGHNNTATIAIDATGDGWAYAGQGFPVRRMVLGGQIDCSQQDLTIHAPTSRGWLSIIIDNQNGHKNAADMRAEVLFNGVSLGKQQLRRQ